MPLLLEIIGLFFFIEMRIWLFGRMGILTWIVTAVPIFFVILSWLARGDTLETLGIKPRDWKKDSDLILASTLCLWFLILWIGFVWNPDFLWQKGVLWKWLKHVPMYYPWALLQNLWLNGYFTNRLEKVLPARPNLVSAAAGILFAIVHWPNPVLLAATLIGGVFSAYFFQRNRNLYWIAFSHAILAVSLKYFLPDAWHHDLKIGPGFWEQWR